MSVTENRKKVDSGEIAWQGRDELNLAEFPIALLASRPRRDVKTVQFEDRIWDKSRGTRVTRRLVISASDKYGLPTALDDEVILGLIQLSREDGFPDRRVFFSRYHLLQILGWRNEGKSYSRLETSLKRWLGVTLYYEKAWWDKAAQSWVDENFHLLEQVSLYDRRCCTRSADCVEPTLSSFVWNEVVFRSFQAGYLKQIDMELFRRLRSPIAKRLYRLLDKRFYHRPKWEFDLRALAHEHVGLSRAYDVGQLKRKLRPAIRELESAGYLRSLDDAKRFTRIGRGQWQVEFSRPAVRKAESQVLEGTEAIQHKLVQRGVNPAVAVELAANRSPHEIEHRIAAFDWLMKRDGQHTPRNPAGFLVQSIRQSYAPPRGYFPPGADVKRQAAGRSTPQCRDSADCPGDEAAWQVRRYLGSLSQSTRQRLEKKAMLNAPPSLAEAYRRSSAEGVPVLSDLYRRLILEQFVASRLKAQAGDGGRRRATEDPERRGRNRPISGKVGALS